MKTKIITDQEGNLNLERNGNVLFCPYKPAITLLKKQSPLQGGGMEQEIVHTPCGSHCPRFEITEETEKAAISVSLNCGGSTTTYYQDEE